MAPKPSSSPLPPVSKAPVGSTVLPVTRNCSVVGVPESIPSNSVPPLKTSILVPDPVKVTTQAFVTGTVCESLGILIVYALVPAVPSNTVGCPQTIRL